MNNLFVRDDLDALKRLFSNPTRWTQGCFARNEHGYGVSPFNREAACWCLMGGVEFISADQGPRATALSAALVKALPPQRGEGAGSILFFNDSEGRKYEDIIALIDRAQVIAMTPAFVPFIEPQQVVVVTGP